MDAPRFDKLTRRLTIGLSRRRGLGLLASLGLPNLISPDAAEAKKKKKPCPPCKKRKQGKCKKKLPDGTACAGGTCQSGSCVGASSPTENGPVPPVCGAGKTCAGPDDCVLGGNMCECKVRADNPNATCCGQFDPGCGTLGIWCTATNTQCPNGMFCTPCQQAGGFFCTFNCA